jgi:hypothetical protein
MTQFRSAIVGYRILGAPRRGENVVSTGRCFLGEKWMDQALLAVSPARMDQMLTSGLGWSSRGELYGVVGGEIWISLMSGCWSKMAVALFCPMR